jgi:hypothetical protein
MYSSKYLRIPPGSARAGSLDKDICFGKTILKNIWHQAAKNFRQF